MRETFVDKSFRQDTLNLISFCNEVIEDYQQQGYKLTVRLFG